MINKNKKGLSVTLFIFILLALTMSYNNFLLSAKENTLIEFDGFYYLGISKYIIENEEVPSLEPLIIRREISQKLTMPLYPLLYSEINLVSNIGLFYLYKYSGFIFLFFYLLFIYLISKNLNFSKSGSIFSSLFFGGFPYILTRSYLPVRENPFILFFLCSLYLITLMPKSVKETNFSIYFLLGLLSISSFLSHNLWIFLIMIILVWILILMSHKKILFLIPFFLIFIFLIYKFNFFYKDILWYLDQTSGFKLLNINYFLQRYGILFLLPFFSGLVGLFKEKINNKLKVYIVFMFCLFFIMLFIDNSFTNRLNLLLSIPISIFSGFGLSLIIKRFSKHFKIFIVFIILTILIPPGLYYSSSYYLDDGELEAALWLNKNTSREDKIITQRGMIYQVSSFSMRKTQGSDIYFHGKEDPYFPFELNKTNIIDYIINLSKNLSDDKSNVYVYISKLKLNEHRYQDNFLNGLDIKEMENQSFKKVYETSKAVIFIYNKNG